MFKDILQNQRELLNTQLKKNFINRDIKDYAQKQLNHKLIKVITGARRVGKSTLALEMLKNKKFGFINFDDPDIPLKDINFIDLTKSIDIVYDTPEYILLDEVQNLESWERYVNSLHRAERNLIVTGSNAKLLSSELSTLLTGRSIEINLLPLSLEEVKANNYFNTTEKTLQAGTFPEVLTSNVDSELYYTSLLESTLVKDVVTRYKLRNILGLRNLTRYLLSNIANLYSYTSIANKLNLSVPTVIDYIGYLEETFLFYTLPIFSFKQPEIDRSSKKIYVCDFAFSYYQRSGLFKNLGAGLENLFFIELVRRGYEPGRTLFYGEDDNGNEIDFVALDKNGMMKLYQVSYSVKDEKTLNREKRSLQNLANKIKYHDIKAYMVTNSKNGFEENKIKFIED